MRRTLPQGGPEATTTFAVAVACGVVAFLLALASVVTALSARGGAVSSLVGINASEPLAPVVRMHDAAFSFSADHLDGAYFYAIAVDPLATGVEHDLVDVPAYRFGHPGYGWLAWLLAAGRSSAVPNTMLLIGLVSMFAAAAAASFLSVELGWSPWAGLLVAFNPGLLFATFADNSEPFAVAVLMVTLIAWMRRRYGWAALGCLVLCMTKEQFVLVPAGLIAWELIQRVRAGADRAPAREWLKRTALLVPGPVALFGWFAYLRSVYGEWPFQQQPLLLNPLTVPPFGYIDTLRRAAGLHASVGEAAQLGGISLPLLLVVGGALLLGIVRAARFRSPIDPVFILLTLLMFSLTWPQLLYPKDLVRIAAVQLVLLPAAIAGVAARPARPMPPSNAHLTRSPA
jgi:hypothetical protein